MNSITNSLVMYNKDYEQHWLEKRCQEVSVRLYRHNHDYQQMIKGIIAYMSKTMSEDFDDYNKLQGISGANIGMAINIIIVRVKDDKLLPMINPKITKYSKGKRTVKSNCGSLCLGEPLEVERSESIEVQFHNTKGHIERKSFEGSLASTIQHEVDHNRGILITKRHWGLVKKQKKIEKDKSK